MKPWICREIICFYCRSAPSKNTWGSAELRLLSHAPSLQLLSAWRGLSSKSMSPKSQGCQDCWSTAMAVDLQVWDSISQTVHQHNDHCHPGSSVSRPPPYPGQVHQGPASFASHKPNSVIAMLLWFPESHAFWAMLLKKKLGGRRDQFSSPRSVATRACTSKNQIS